MTALHNTQRSTSGFQGVTLPPPTIAAGTVLRMDGVRQLILRITPADAALLLQNLHPRQRNLNKDRVQQYLRSMQVGKWHEPPFTFDSIAFDAEGRLCNGRHRLTALSQHDKPLTFFAIVGVKSPDDMPLPEGDQPLVRRGSFLAGADTHDWAVINYLAEHVYGTSSPARTETQMMLPLFADALLSIRRMGHRQASAAVRAGFAFAWAETQPTLASHMIAEQWEAYCTLDITRLWGSVARLYKNMQEKGKGASNRHWRFACTLYALENPEAIRVKEFPGAAERVKSWVEKAQQEAR